MKNQVYVITDDDENAAWDAVNNAEHGVYMTQEALSAILVPMGFNPDVDYLFEQQNSDHNNGITINGHWSKARMDLDSFMALIEARGSRTLFVGDGLTGFKPTKYHESNIRQTGYAGNEDLRIWFDKLQALCVDEMEFEANAEPSSPEDFVALFYMITDTIRRHNDALQHSEYEHNLERIREYKQENLDCEPLVEKCLEWMLEDSGDHVMSVATKDNADIKSLVEKRDIVHRILMERGAEKLADLITGGLFNHPEATVASINDNT